MGGYGYRAEHINQGYIGTREAPFALDLTVKIARDGSARADGVIRIPDDPAAGPLSPYAPLIVSAKTVLAASCLDLDGDGRRGLTRLAGEFRDATGEPVFVILTVPAHDVDANGTYAVALEIGETTATGDARFRVDVKPPRKGRRAR
jgi:hypothetical protein